jgi:hypothetical protein
MKGPEATAKKAHKHDMDDHSVTARQSDRGGLRREGRVSLAAESSTSPTLLVFLSARRGKRNSGRSFFSWDKLIMSRHIQTPQDTLSRSASHRSEAEPLIWRWCLQSLAKSASSLTTAFLFSGPTAKALALKIIRRHRDNFPPECIERYLTAKLPFQICQIYQINWLSGWGISGTGKCT